MSEMEHDITQYRDSSQTIIRRVVILVGVIAYTILILQIMTLPTKHALSPLFRAFSVPLLDTSSQTDYFDPTTIQNIDVSMNRGENNHGFMIKQLEPNVEKHGNKELQIGADQMVEAQQSEKQAETFSRNDDVILLHGDLAIANNTELSMPKMQDMNQQLIQI